MLVDGSSAAGKIPGFARDDTPLDPEERPAWLIRPGSDQPDRSIVLVGATQAEAEARARAWIASIYNLPVTIPNP